MYNDKSYDMAPNSIVMLDGSENLIFNTSKVENVTIDTKRTIIQNKFSWKWWNDRNYPNIPSIYSTTPLEQLALTHDESDYLFYTRNLSVSTSGQQTLIVVSRVANAFLAFVDGTLQSYAGNYQHGQGIFNAHLPLNLQAGNHELTLLSISMGIDSGVGSNIGNFNFFF